MKHKWLISTCRPTRWRAPARKGRAELVYYFGKFVSENTTKPGAQWEEVRTMFWATKRDGVARMLSALGMGPLTAEELIARMGTVKP